MFNREIEIQAIRPAIAFENIEASPINDFQKTLRQILKFQNDILVEVCFYYLINKYKGFVNKDEAFKRDAFYKSLKKDVFLKKDLIGLIKGLMTLEDLYFYQQNTSNINKRLLEFIFKRVNPQVISKKNDINIT